MRARLRYYYTPAFFTFNVEFHSVKRSGWDGSGLFEVAGGGSRLLEAKGGLPLGLLRVARSLKRRGRGCLAEAKTDGVFLDALTKI